MIPNLSVALAPLTDGSTNQTTTSIGFWGPEKKEGIPIYNAFENLISVGSRYGMSIPIGCEENVVSKMHFLLSWLQRVN